METGCFFALIHIIGKGIIQPARITEPAYRYHKPLIKYQEKSGRAAGGPRGTSILCSMLCNLFGA